MIVNHVGSRYYSSMKDSEAEFPPDIGCMRRADVTIVVNARERMHGG